MRGGHPSFRARTTRALLAVLVAVGGLLGVPAVVQLDAARAAISTLPPGFQSQVVFSGLNTPVAFAFAADGHVFVAEKRGVVKVFDGLHDPTPTTFADLRTEVFDYNDRGMLGIAVAPNFPADPYVYVLYAHDAPIGGTAPRWGDTCPTPPGPTTDGCVASSRLSRLRANGDMMTGTEQVLIEDWCAQFPSHSIGALAFGPDGALYASGGEGAGFNGTDYGQYGGTLAGSPDSIPKNPCGDPPGGVAATLTPPSAEGGALRAQDSVTGSDPTALNGSIIRIDPGTGAPLPDNPNASAADVNARRIVAMGMRNPFRFAFRPGTTDLWVGDVGWNNWEEVDRNPDTRTTVTNFGWPCDEGAAPQPGYQALGLALCQSLYDTPGAVTAPVYTYAHNTKVVPNDPDDACGSGGGGSSVTGMAFSTGNSYPAKYDGALFFGDFSRRCISVMLAGSDGIPDPTRVEHFASGVGVSGATDIEAGPGGDIFFADPGSGSINRIRYFPNNQPPQARLRSDATSGALPLTVHFDASDSSDADGDPLTYAWDLDNDGSFDDGSGATKQATFFDAASYTVRTRVTDSVGATDIAQVVVHSGNRAPSVTIDAPTSATQWSVGQAVSFSATATDPDDGALPAAAYDWSLTLLHCPDVDHCHQHPIEQFHGVRSGSFVAPDHEYPVRLLLQVTAADAGGVSATQSLEILPSTRTMTVATNVAGATVAVDSDAPLAPFTKTVIAGSEHVVSAPLQTIGGSVYDFDAWSDGGAQTHTVTAPGNVIVTASLSPRTLRAGDAEVVEAGSGTNTTVSVPVRLNAPATRQVTVQWATQPGTAGSTDYTTASGVLVFPAGTTEQDATVTIAGDNVVESDETFGVHLSAAQNATIADDLATVTVHNDVYPTANAGPDQTISSRATTTLDASGSFDSQHQPLTYSWTQIDGPLAVIDDRSAVRPHITAPAGPTTLKFRVTVTDTSGASNSDDVSITVKAPK
jgi:glucose/arabinose dehydrogenase